MFSKERHRLTIDLPPDHFIWTLPPKARSALVREYLTLGQQYDRIMKELEAINQKISGRVDMPKDGGLAGSRNEGTNGNGEVGGAGLKNNGVHMESLFEQF